MPWNPSRRMVLLQLPMAAGLAGREAAAQDFPRRPITLVIPFVAGGNVDGTARIVASQMEKVLGRSVIVLNRPGASGMIAADYVKQSAPDGYTLLVGSNGPLLAPVFRTASYDVQRDFVSIGLISWTAECLIVRGNLPVNTVAELLQHARSAPIRAATGSIDTAPGLALAEFNLQARLELLAVIYRGAAEYYPALLGGHVDIAFDTISTAVPMARNGGVRILAVADDTRSTFAPEVPTFAEAGMEQMVSGAFVGLSAPSGTPRGIVAILQRAFATTMASPEVKGQLESLGSVIRNPSPEALDEIIRRQTEKARLIRAAQGPNAQVD
jgi:tripartite-type tricarboxylate transporter receptor subunit TctC